VPPYCSPLFFCPPEPREERGRGRWYCNLMASLVPTTQSIKIRYKSEGLGARVSKEGLIVWRN
jgi:hypothetical protein